MTFNFAGKVALVLGGNSGIGLASALELAKGGARVAIGGRNPQTGAEAVAQVRECGSEAIFIPTDIRSSDSVQGTVRQTLEAFGALHVLVNSAGEVGVVASTHECSEDNWHLLIDTNLTGTFLAMKYAIPAILDSGGGAVVNVASVIGVVGFPGLPAYTASKAGMIGLTKAAALDYAERGVRVNIVCPGSIRTPMFVTFSGGSAEAEQYMAKTFHPIGRIGEAPEVASAVAWLASDGASFVTGHVLPVAGGWEVK